MSSIWMGIAPGRTSTRVLAMHGASETILKARLLRDPAHPRAFATLLEAIALWQGSPVRAALVVDSRRASSGTSLYRDSFPAFGSALYTLDYVEALRKPLRRDPLTAMGPFGDLRQLLLFEAAR